MKKLLERFFKNYHFLAIIFLTTILGGLLRFYKLDWGEGFFFHPDEYHIVMAVDRLSFPLQMNPKLFSYGSFTVYLIYFTKTLLNLKISSFIIGRFYSALFSTLTIPLIYLIAEKVFKNKKFAVISTILGAAIPGLIQQAHFATPESSLTFWLFLTVFFLLKFIDNKKVKYILTAAAALGLAMGVKVTAALYLPLTLLAPMVIPKQNSTSAKILSKKLFFVLAAAATTTAFFLAVFPYSVLDFRGFTNSMNYETAVGRGTMLVFYTRQFINTVPIVFQVEKILPFSVGPMVLIFGLLGLTLMATSLLLNIKEYGKTEFRKMLLLVSAFCLFFFPNAILFAKWSRFIAPTLPFFAIFCVYFFVKLSQSATTNPQKKVVNSILYLTVLSTIFWSVMFFSIYTHHDVRIQANNWLNTNLPKGSYVLTESGNMLEVPLTGNIQKYAFEFYHLDEDMSLQRQLPQYLEKADYFVVQSRRIYADHQPHPSLFPATSAFYNNLFSGNLGFKEVKEFTSFPKLEIDGWKLEINDESAEETWSVFDHPAVRVYKKVTFLSQNEYEKILNI